MVAIVRKLAAVEGDLDALAVELVAVEPILHQFAAVALDTFLRETRPCP